MTAPTEITRVVLIANPASTDDGVSVAKDLKQRIYGVAPRLPVEIQETKRAGHGEQLAAAAAQKKGTLIVSVSGDGGYHEVINGAVAGSDGPPLCAVYGAGNANDHYQTVQEGEDLAELLANGQIEPVSLLEVSVKDRNEQRSRLAHSYVGFGITARIAERLNRENVTPLSEIGLVMKMLRDHRPLTADLGEGPRRYDVLLAFNIGRMGKYLKVKETDPGDGSFSLVRMPVAPAWKWPVRVARSLIGGIHPDWVTDELSAFFPRAVKLQLDGEVIACVADSTVTIRAVPGAIRTLRPRT